MCQKPYSSSQTNDYLGSDVVLHIKHISDQILEPSLSVTLNVSYMCFVKLYPGF